MKSPKYTLILENGTNTTIVHTNRTNQIQAFIIQSDLNVIADTIKIYKQVSNTEQYSLLYSKNNRKIGF